MRLNRSLFRVLGPMLLLLTGGLFLGTTSASAYPATSHVDGYLSSNGTCLMLQEHGGGVLALRGNVRGLTDGDHVRLEGRFAPDPGCGAPGFAVTMVQAIWGDDRHRTTYFDHLSGESFTGWAERTGRFGERREYYESGPSYERPDRYGRYVYEGPHRWVTLVGRVHESEGACPTLSTSYATFALDGSLGDYQAGDRVLISGMLYDQDPNAPCGGPTVVIHRIRGR